MPIKEVRPQGMFKSPTAPFSIATRLEGRKILHISGQVPQDGAGNNVALGDVEGQTHQVIKNIKAIVEDQGGSLGDISRLLIFITQREFLAPIMKVRHQYFSEPYPAATAVVVSGLAHADWLVEIEATAALA
jgi:2-iminobutanoate/2-iminopropanoate deaminase